MICPLRNVDCGCNKRVTDRDKRIATLEEQVAANTFSQEAFDILAQRCKTLEAALRKAEAAHAKGEPMSEIVLKRRTPLGTVRYVLEKVMAGCHTLLIHDALEALERAERELAEAREQGRAEERERVQRIIEQDMADVPGVNWVGSLRRTILRRIEGGE